MNLTLPIQSLFNPYSIPIQSLFNPHAQPHPHGHLQQPPKLDPRGHPSGAPRFHRFEGLWLGSMLLRLPVTSYCFLVLLASPARVQTLRIHPAVNSRCLPLSPAFCNPSKLHIVYSPTPIPQAKFLELEKKLALEKAKVCGWRVYCCDFLLLRIAPGVSCSW